MQIANESIVYCCTILRFSHIKTVKILNNVTEVRCAVAALHIAHLTSMHTIYTKVFSSILDGKQQKEEKKKTS